MNMKTDRTLREKTEFMHLFAPGRFFAIVN